MISIIDFFNNKMKKKRQFFVNNRRNRDYFDMFHEIFLFNAEFQWLILFNIWKNVKNKKKSTKHNINYAIASTWVFLL